VEVSLEDPREENQAFVIITFLNVAWIFVTVQIAAVLLFLNLSILFPHSVPDSHIFVLDSAEYIEEIYYYGSGPEEVDWKYLNRQWHQSDVTSG